MRGGDFMKRILIAALLGATLVVSAEVQRDTAVVVLSFISPVAREALDSYDYRNCKNAPNESRNFPLPLVRLPEKAVLYGGDGYAALEHAAALEHMKRIKAANFDMVYFDMLPIPDYDPSRPLTTINEPFYYFSNYFEWMRAAEETGLKLGIFADVANQSARYPKYRNITKAEWVKILEGALKLSPDSPATWRENGKVGIIHFQTDCVYAPKAAPVPGAPMPDGGWREVWKELRERGNEFFFVSDVRPHDRDGEWNDIAEAAYFFAPASPTACLTEYQADISSRLNKIPYYWTQSCGYHRRRRDYTQPDFQRLHDVYNAAMKAGATRMVTMTWNDLNEDHDIWPSSNKGSEILDIVGYYNQWFKNGEQPGVEKEKLVVCYPFRAPAGVASKAPVYNAGAWVAPEFAPRLFYWANLKAPRRVELAGREVELNAGLTIGEIELDPGEDPAIIPVTAKVDGRARMLPPVRKIASEGENGEGGLEHRYLDLLTAPAPDVFTLPKVYWDLSKNDDAAAAWKDHSLTFTAVPGKHNWIYARNNMPEESVSPEARFVRLAYRGKIPAGMKMVCVLQEEGGVSGIYENLPAPSENESVDVIIPLAQFKRTGWSAASPVKIPTASRIRWGHLGAIGTPAAAEDLAGNVTIEAFSFLR